MFVDEIQMNNDTIEISLTHDDIPEREEPLEEIRGGGGGGEEPVQRRGRGRPLIQFTPEEIQILENYYTVKRDTLRRGRTNEQKKIIEIGQKLKDNRRSLEQKQYMDEIKARIYSEV
jgi:hypothetical protein